MRSQKSLIIGIGLIAVIAVGAIVARDAQQDQTYATQFKEKLSPDKEKDRDAIEKASSEFGKAFAAGDAKAVASFWTANGEYHEESGEVLRGRIAIEKAFAEHFKEKPDGKIEVRVESLRFLSRDSAIEEGLLRQGSAGKDLPTSSLYSVIHVRDNGQWKMAVVREWGAGQDRLDDLDWLIGAWQSKVKERDITLTFAKDKKKPFLVGEFAIKEKGKVVSSGSMKIGFDAQRGQLRSWHFDDDGGHGQAMWIRDGNRWVLDAIGALANGAETGAVNILARINNNELTWRSIDRVVGDAKLPDTVPIKLSRVIDKK